MLVANTWLCERNRVKHGFNLKEMVFRPGFLNIHCSGAYGPRNLKLNENCRPFFG
jgi:hypothetical protein